MNAPSSLHLERARRVLEHEGALGAGGIGMAASRVYDKIHAHLGPLLGAAGVRALLVRSAKLTQGEFSFLDAVTLESSTTLRESLEAQELAIARDGAAVLFGTFFALITTFIGDRLTVQVLRRAWPTIEATSEETRE